MKKLIIFFFFIFFPFQFVHAVIFIPTAEITIIKNTVSEDGVFDFSLYDNSFISIDEFQINTQGNTGSYSTTVVTGFGNAVFRIFENQHGDWQLQNVTCTSDSPANSFVSLPDGMQLNISPSTATTCVFTNARTTQVKPVLIVPGVLGTEMFRTSEKLWPDVLRMLSDVGDDFMDPLAFNVNLQPGDINVTKNLVIKREITFNYTEGLINAFSSQNYLENQEVFLFPYDWRYGVSGRNAQNQTNVDLLQEKIDEILTQTGADKIDIVSHSTGGLLVKKYVMDHPADHRINKAVFVGVPNLGAPKAVKVLTSGDNFNIIGLSDAEMKKIAQNMPVVYDLTPSQTYFDRKGSFARLIEQDGLSTVYNDLDYSETRIFLLSDHNLNQTAYDNAQDLHTLAFDDFDLRSAGVDLYNIVGCKTGTLAKFLENRLSGETTLPTLDFIPQPTPGDGTVPLESATNLPVDSDQKFFALKADHGKMLSQDGIRQAIVNLITGSTLATPKISSNIADCKLNGKAVAIYSPVDVEVFDQDGSRLGLAEDGSIQNDIPNADFSVFGEHKFLYLPDDEGQTYTINLQGAGGGTFILKTLEITDNQNGQSQNFIDIPVTAELTGTLEFDAGNSILRLDTNGDGNIDQTLAPTTVLDPDQSQDLLPPVTTPTLVGTQGDEGFFRSDVAVTLTAADTVVPGQESQTSGILKTEYSLDGGAHQQCPPLPQICAINIALEGSHTLAFFSTDRAGNREPEQSLSFTIDKTAPEASIQFSATAKDLQFTGNDNLSTSSGISILDQDDKVTLTDQAGNQTAIKLKEKDRKRKLKAELKSISYNGQEQDLTKNQLRFNWQLAKNQSLKALNQRLKVQKDFNIEAKYQAQTNQTKIQGKDQSGKIKQTFPGLILLKVTTNQGDLGWSY